MPCPYDRKMIWLEAYPRIFRSLIPEDPRSHTRTECPRRAQNKWSCEPVPVTDWHVRADRPASATPGPWKLTGWRVPSAEDCQQTTKQASQASPTNYLKTINIILNLNIKMAASLIVSKFLIPYQTILLQRIRSC
ncbi:hypothetical protein PGT21_012832 [Puccinia graminis f. sp. tritici]|uniref:Uncharacterized protein n=1 Tax=Puccinia graminis f. sp. tritici TaxID=56615 RepID=A0A5B0QF95_PUCGR|nr:hypothetical protein PGT21_015071 [Puccinia graminis f. sp. tritici]KAA1093549.1 hypothetical protein PGTUg99_026818 [Puccinia graminis f. sp. tritici]KAA1111812.1 hypothetical protein PGT21_012832 [Puccinia graminis f. sp. tritici]